MLNHTETKKKSNLLNVYKRFPVSFTHGFGTKLYDEDGKEYTDFLSGIGVNAFGHNNLVIKEFVREQLDKYWHVSNLFEIELQEELSNKLFSYSGLSNVFFSNSGTEANEAAIKFARLWGKGRFEIITAIDSFHGRTFGSLSATGQFNLWKDFKPILPGFKYVTFNDIDAIKNNITENSVAVMLEVIQGEGGINIPDENYLLEVEKICRENDLLLIIDEIQSGMG
ncbi:MAG: aminotransferase class III-fold pyridoxal phosphate-dependent enzyme, partial [Ignavibacteria bacterium]